MPKHEAGTPKAIANRIKAKGLQKLRWYCQMCQKQCRDENGFKCHLMSESHQRQLLLFGENSEQYLDDFSKEFEASFMDILRRQFGTKRVRANIVYQEYIKDRDHVHMNSTTWLTLTTFVNYLGRAGICKIDNTEKGWYIQYIDRSEEERNQKYAKKQKMDKDDDERIQEFIQKQAEKARENSAAQAEPTYTELQKREDEKVEFAFSGKLKKEDSKPVAITSAFKPIKKPTQETKSSKLTIPDILAKPSTSALDEIREEEERRKEMRNRKDYWLHEGIIVKIVTKKADERYFKKKALVVGLEDQYTGTVALLENPNEQLKIDQAHLETVIPALGKTILVVNGAYRGLKATLESLDEKTFSVSIRIAEGTTKGRLVSMVQYEDICKLNV